MLSSFIYGMLIVVGVNLGFALVVQSPFQADHLDNKVWRVFKPLVLTGSILLIGLIFNHTWMQGRLGMQWPVYVCLLLLAAHIPWSMYIMMSHERYRYFLASVCAFEFTLSLVLTIIAHMMVTGSSMSSFFISSTQ